MTLCNDSTAVPCTHQTCSFAFLAESVIPTLLPGPHNHTHTPGATNLGQPTKTTETNRGQLRQTPLNTANTPQKKQRGTYQRAPRLLVSNLRPSATIRHSLRHAHSQKYCCSGENALRCRGARPEPNYFFLVLADDAGRTKKNGCARTSLNQEHQVFPGLPSCLPSCCLCRPPPPAFLFSVLLFSC